MTIPITKAGLSDIQAEFGGASPIALSRYYAGSGLVSNPAPTSAYQKSIIPTSGKIGIGNFLGVTRATPVTIAPWQSQVDMYGHGNGPWSFSSFVSPSSYGANATNLHFLLVAGGGVPSINSGASYSWSFAFLSGENRYSAWIANPQDNSGSELPIPTNQADQSIKDFIVTGNQSGNIANYRVTVTDGLTSASIYLNVGLWW